MPAAAAPALVLGDDDREVLTRLSRAPSTRAGLAQRARIVLLAAEGTSNTRIAELVGVSRPTVIAWRARFVALRLDGLEDEVRSGRPRHVDHEEPRFRTEDVQGTAPDRSGKESGRRRRAGHVPWTAFRTHLCEGIRARSVPLEGHTRAHFLQSSRKWAPPRIVALQRLSGGGAGRARTDDDQIMSPGL